MREVVKKRIFGKEEVQRACEEGSSELLEHVSKGEWVAEGKYDSREIILVARDDGKHYRYCESRSGSPFSYYTYSWEWEKDEIELVEVYQVEKVVIVWEEVHE